MRCFFYLFQIYFASCLHLNERRSESGSKFIPEVFGSTQFAKELMPVPGWEVSAQKSMFTYGSLMTSGGFDGTKMYCTVPQWSFAGSWSGGGCYSMLSMLGLLKSIYYQTYSGLAPETMPMTMVGCNSGGCWAISMSISYWYAMKFVGTVNPDTDMVTVDPEMMLRAPWPPDVAEHQALYVYKIGPLAVLAADCPGGQVKGACALGEYCLDRVLMGGCHGGAQFAASIQQMGCTFDVLVDGDDTGSKYANLYNTSVILREVVPDLMGTMYAGTDGFHSINTHWALECIQDEGCNAYVDAGAKILSMFGMNAVCVDGFDPPSSRSDGGKSRDALKSKLEFATSASWALAGALTGAGARSWSEDQTNTLGIRRRTMYMNDMYTPNGPPLMNIKTTTPILEGTPYEILQLLVEELSYLDYVEDMYTATIYDNLLSVFADNELIFSLVSTETVLSVWRQELTVYAADTSAAVRTLNSDFFLAAQASSKAINEPIYYDYLNSYKSCQYQVGFLISEVQMVGWTVLNMYKFPHSSAIPWPRTLAKVGNAGSAGLTIMYLQYSVVLNCAWFVYLIQYQTIKGQFPWPYGSLSKAFLKKVARRNPALFERVAVENQTSHTHARHHAPMMMLQAMSLQEKQKEEKPSLGVYEFSMDGAAIDNNAVSEAVYLMDSSPHYLRPETLVMFITGESTPSSELNVALALTHFTETLSYYHSYVGSHSDLDAFWPLASPWFSLCPAGHMTVKNRYFLFTSTTELSPGCTKAMMLSSTSLGPYGSPGDSVNAMVAEAVSTVYNAEDAPGIDLIGNPKCLTPLAQATLAGMLFWDNVLVAKNSYWNIVGGWETTIYSTLMNANQRTKAYIETMYYNSNFLYDRYFHTFPWLAKDNQLGFFVQTTDAFAVMTYSSYRGYMMNCAMQIKTRLEAIQLHGSYKLQTFDPGYFYTWTNAIKYPALVKTNPTQADILKVKMGTGLDPDFVGGPKEVAVDVPSDITGEGDEWEDKIVPDACMVCATFHITCEPFLQVVQVSSTGSDWGDMAPNGPVPTAHLGSCEAYISTEPRLETFPHLPSSLFTSYTLSPSFLSFSARPISSPSANSATAKAECAMLKLELCSIIEVKSDLDTTMLALGPNSGTGMKIVAALNDNSFWMLQNELDDDALPVKLSITWPTLSFTKPGSVEEIDGSGKLKVFCCTSFGVTNPLSLFVSESSQRYAVSGNKRRNYIWGYMKFLKISKTALNVYGASLVKGSSICAKKESTQCNRAGIDKALKAWTTGANVQNFKCPDNQNKKQKGLCWAEQVHVAALKSGGNIRISSGSGGQEETIDMVPVPNMPTASWVIDSIIPTDPEIRIKASEFIICCGEPIDTPYVENIVPEQGTSSNPVSSPTSNYMME